MGKAVTLYATNPDTTNCDPLVETKVNPRAAIYGQPSTSHT